MLDPSGPGPGIGYHQTEVLRSNPVGQLHPLIQIVHQNHLAATLQSALRQLGSGQTANADFCAADMIAQAEHDPLATAILVTDSPGLIQEVEASLDRQLPGLARADLAKSALESRGKAVLVENLEEAVELANRVAPEHLCLMVADPWSWAGRVKHAGGLFLGEFSPEVMGDYVAGPSHVMPTGGTARYGSALSVHHFLRTMPVVGLSPAEFQKLGQAAVHIADAEGLSGHASAIQVRLDSLAEGA